MKNQIRPFILLLTLLLSQYVYPQCSSCTSTVSTNTNLTVAAGTTVCLTFAGTYNKTITLAGGTLCISSATTVNGATINMTLGSTIDNYGTYRVALNNWNAGYTFNNYGTFNAGISMGGGTVTNTGTMTVSSATFNSGTLTNGSTGTISIPGGTNFNSGFTLNSTGTATIPGFTVNSGATVSLTGTNTIIGNVSNNGSFTLSGSTITGTFTNNSGTTTNFSNGVTITGNTTNNGTINLNGDLSIGGTYSDNSGATIKETQAGCSTVTISSGTPAGNGTFNGNGNGLIINTAPSNGGSLINGASASLTAPTQSATTFSSSLSGTVITASFTAPSATINGYLVLMSVGSVAPTDVPTNYSDLFVGSTVGSSTVQAIITGNSTGTKIFLDTIPANSCGLNVYFRIFSFSGNSGCRVYRTTPLTGTQAIPVVVAPTITPSGATTFCSGGSVTLTASGATSYVWSTGATTATISVNSTGTYRVTSTNAQNCTATASVAVTVNTPPTPSVNNATSCSGSVVTLTATGGTTYVWSTGATTASITTSTAGTYTVTATSTGCTATASGVVSAFTSPTTSATSNSPVAPGASVTLSSSTSGGSIPYTYSWSGPASFSSALANPVILSSTTASAGTYVITVTDNNGCSATANTTVVIAGPGGVSTNLALWVKANALALTNGSTVSTWTNSTGGTSPSQVTVANRPIFYNTSTDYINYYPVVGFDGSNDELSATSFSGTSTYSQSHIFMVAKVANNTQANSVLYEGQATSGGESGRINVHLPWSGTTYWDGGTCCTNNRVTTTFPNADVNVPRLFSFSKDVSGTANGSQQQDIRKNGLTIATKATNTSFTGNSSPFYLGSGGGTSYFNGQIAEAIYYLGASINAATQNKIESYLALKYGITLDQTTPQNYTSSTGATIWDATINSTYNKNIFGVGIDNGSSLSQTQAYSINTNFLTISNANALTNNSFLIVGDDNGANTISVTANLPSGVQTLLNRKWRAEQTGTRGAVDLTIYYSNINLGYFSSLTPTPYLMVDSNADGIYDVAATAYYNNGAKIIFNYSLKDGAIFTFGFKTVPIDFGDANSMQTTVANNGAGHVISTGVYLGTKIDAEIDGVVSFNSVGDDTIGLADEDGVDFNIGVATGGLNILQVGVANSVKVTANTTGYLNAWIDLNQNGTFDGGSEYAIQNIALTAGVNTVTFNLSDSISYGNTVMRFRFAKNLGDVTAPTGLAPNGEVEDYKVYMTAPLVSPCNNGFQNPGFEMGPYPTTYIITGDNNLHFWRTTASDRMIEVWKSGFNGVPAYSGTYFVELNANTTGALYQDVYTTPGTALVWKFSHRGRAGVDSCNLRIGPPGATVTKKIVGDGTTAWGVYTGAYVVPAGQYITRFEFNALYCASGNLSIGNFIDDMSVSTSFDYGDAPDSYKTTKANNGPYHSMTGSVYLGANVSCDLDGQPSAAATLDTYDDGVTFPAPCGTCNTYTVTINATNTSGSPATIAGWIDFNKNGVFDNAERASITIPSSGSAQTVSLTFTLTPSMYTTSSAPGYARFRIANDSTEVALPYGLATSGEVEDYLVNCVALSIPVPTSNNPVCMGSTLTLSTTLAGVYQAWTGPNGYTSTGQTTTRPNIQLADSGLYRVYAIYANGCQTDSAITKVTVQRCYVTVSGSIFDDANGNGVQNAGEPATTNGQTIYAVTIDTNNTILTKALIAANGTFTLTSVPAYQAGMSIIVTTANPVIGGSLSGSIWPTNWVGTYGQYGTNNLAGTGTYTGSSQWVKVYSGVSNVSNLMLGYDRLPATVLQNYTIGYPFHNSVKSLTAASGLGPLQGNDPEDGPITSMFTITNVSGMNGNTLFYDVNNNGIVDPGETISGYTVITSFVPAYLKVKFTGLGSTQANFTYGTVDAAGKSDPSPQTYTIRWIGALPVKLTSFDADKLDDTKAIIKWVTASEEDNDYFEVERSRDAQTWEAIGQVKGNGTTTVSHSYSLIDTKPEAGVNYYRLRQVDVDKKDSYSDIAQVTFDGDGTNTPITSVAVYPNPSTPNGTLHIDLNGSTDALSHITITNLMGQTVHESDAQDEHTLELSGMNLETGVYLINITTTANKHFTNRIVIQ